jgi:CRP-like cAMP-binding protein
MPPPGPADEPGFLDLLPATVSQRLLTDSRRRYPQGATLFTDGDVAGDVHVLISGRVKVLTDPLIGRPVLLALRGPGDLVGELAAFDGGRRSATAVALEDTVTVSLTIERFRALLLAHPAVTLHLLGLTAARLRDADAKRVEFTALDSGGRVARRLVELAEGWGERVPEGLLVDLGLTQDEIASWTGASREALTRALGAFRSRGWISTERRRVLLLDVEAMRKRGS